MATEPEHTEDMPKTPQASPLACGPVSGTFVWFLAFAPILGLILECVASGITGIAVAHLWLITLALNIGLSYADDGKLRKAGHDTSKMGQAWLIPVYLWKRAGILKQSKAYFWVWTILFCLVVFTPFGEGTPVKANMTVSELATEAKALHAEIQNPMDAVAVGAMLAAIRDCGGHLEPHQQAAINMLKEENPSLGSRLDAFAETCRKSPALQEEIKQHKKKQAEEARQRKIKEEADAAERKRRQEEEAKQRKLKEEQEARKRKLLEEEQRRKAEEEARQRKLREERKKEQEKKLADVTLTEEDAKANPFFKYVRELRLIQSSVAGVPKHKLKDAQREARKKIDALVKNMNAATVEVLYGGRIVGTTGMYLRYNKWRKGYTLEDGTGRLGLLLRSTKHEYLDLLDTYWLDACLPCRGLCRGLGAYTFQVHFKKESDDAVAKLKATLEKQKPGTVILRIRGRVKATQSPSSTSLKLDSILLVDAELVGEPVILRKPRGKK